MKFRNMNKCVSGEWYELSPVRIPSEAYFAARQARFEHGETPTESEIECAPTVDAVPVIRCKDCKHYYALNEVRGNCSEYNFVEKIPIDYCSWAERRTDD